MVEAGEDNSLDDASHATRNSTRRNQGLRELLPEELQAAEKLLIKRSQRISFGEEWAQLKAGKPLKKSSRLFSLSPRLDEHGIITMSGRIDKGEAAEDVKRPVILN